jgi:hypothetical protein
MDILMSRGVEAILQVIISGIAFGLAHTAWILFKGEIKFTFSAFLSTSLLGIFLAIIYLVGGCNLDPCIFSHVLINTIIEPWFIVSSVSRNKTPDNESLSSKAVSMSLIALTIALNLSASPYPFMMGIVYALAASFLSPVVHQAKLLVMSPGGYRFSDYFKQGLPLALIVLATSIPLLPILFPFFDQ